MVSGAGGVGSLAVQLGKQFGAGRVIATASSEEKRAKTLELGADAAVDPEAEDLTAAILEANEGRQVDVVLEMSGGRMFDGAIEALAPFGRIVAYGIAGREQNELPDGPADAQEPRGHRLLAHALPGPPRDDGRAAGRAARPRRAGLLVPQVGETYPMSEIRRAHEDLAGRRTSGKLLLDPSG